MPEGVTVAQLQYFVSAHRHGSLSAAAAAHFVAQPSVSDQIRRLELTLGVALFVRTNRRLLLTEAGRTFLPHAEKALLAVDEAVSSVDPVRTLTGGSVSFATFSSAHHLLHTELAARFHHAHPHVRLRLVGMNSVQVADSVRSGDHEAGLVALPVDDRGLQVSPVVWATEAVYLSAYPERTRRPPTIAQVAHADLVLPEVRWGSMDPTRRQLAARAQNAGVDLRPALEVESPSVAIELALRGVVDTVISLALVHALGHGERLHWVCLDPPVTETFAFVTRRGSEPTAAAAVVMDLARAILAEIPAAPSRRGDGPTGSPRRTSPPQPGRT